MKSKKQFFSPEIHTKFQQYFQIPNNPGEYDSLYLEKTYKYISYIYWLPGLEMIGVGNSISMNIATKKSDIDLFIITSDHTLWLVRIFLTLYFGILGVRKTKNKHQARFCLSFFVTSSGMDFASWCLDDDVYLYFWILYLKPILNYNNNYQKFIQSQSWADYGIYSDYFEKNASFIRFTGEKKNYFFLSPINTLLKKIFLRKTKKSFEKLKNPFGIIISKDILKFHNNDIRKQIIKELIEN